mmetsp:Transcript_9537/g.40476  ORF Transcript_9537/g.40476 Transcript_9537/m.40476 type:complete len:303 (+) Transcript_9537:934-1842(+)
MRRATRTKPPCHRTPCARSSRSLARSIASLGNRPFGKPKASPLSAMKLSISLASAENCSKCLFSDVRLGSHPSASATSLYPPCSKIAWCTSHRLASNTSAIAGITGWSSPPPLATSGSSNVSAPETSLYQKVCVAPLSVVSVSSNQNACTNCSSASRSKSMFSQYPSGFREDSNPSASATEDQSPKLETRVTRSLRPARTRLRRRGMPITLCETAEQYGAKSRRSDLISELRNPRSNRPTGGSMTSVRVRSFHLGNMDGTNGTKCATGSRFTTPPAPRTSRSPRTRSTSERGGESDSRSDSS